MNSIAQAGPPPGRMQRRLTGFIFAGLLQVALVWALVAGLDIKVWPVPDRPMRGEVIRDTTLPPLPPPRTPTTVEPARPEPVKPTIVIVESTGGESHAITPEEQGTRQPADLGQPAQAIMATHTKPPYPPYEARLGIEGTVELHLTISPQGIVTAAAVVRSSGSDGLDQAARVWVMSHWRYRPALRGGAPVAAAADVVVRFNLANAG